MSDIPFRPSWRHAEHVPADEPTADLLRHVRMLEAKVSTLTEHVLNERLSPPGVRVNVHMVLEDMVREQVRFGLTRAAGTLHGERTVERFVRHAEDYIVNAVMAGIEDVIVFPDVPSEEES